MPRNGSRELHPEKKAQDARSHVDVPPDSLPISTYCSFLRSRHDRYVLQKLTILLQCTKHDI